MEDLQDLALVIESRVPLVVLETWDEAHATALLTRVAMRSGRNAFSWSITEGLRRAEVAAVRPNAEPEDPMDLLQTIKRQRGSALFILFDFHPYLQGRPEIIRHVKDIALAYNRLGHTLLFISHEIELPPEIRRYSARFDLTPPSETRLAAILREEIRDWMRDHDQRRPEIEPAALQALLSSIRGTNALDARRLIRAAIRDDGAINESDIDVCHRAKFELLDMEGLMSLETDRRRMTSLGGLQNLKQWLDVRGPRFKEGGADQPRGMLLTGVQGTGKSLAAKAVAASWALPLLRLDMATLYNKFIGETEKNLRRCLQQAEHMSPCVLWIDEIEKGLAESRQDDATSRRVLGTLLTWLAERQSSVFLVATANDISSLPPELLRKGRIDEIFFVDLPCPSARENIFSIHLERRHLDPEHYDLPALALLSEGFSGAEIEQAIVAAIHVAAAQGSAVSSEQIAQELGRTQPLSVTMAEKVTALRHWAQGRAVAA